VAQRKWWIVLSHASPSAGESVATRKPGIFVHGDGLPALLGAEPSSRPVFRN